MCCTGMLLLFGVSCSPGGGCGTADAMASWCPWRVLRLRLLPVKEKMIKVTIRPIKLVLIFFLLFTADARNVCVNRVISQNEAVRWKQIKTHINEWSKPRSRIVTFGLTRFFKVDGGAFFLEEMLTQGHVKWKSCGADVKGGKIEWWKRDEKDSSHERENMGKWNNEAVLKAVWEEIKIPWTRIAAMVWVIACKQITNNYRSVKKITWYWLLF